MENTNDELKESLLNVNSENYSEEVQFNLSLKSHRSDSMSSENKGSEKVTHLKKVGRPKGRKNSILRNSPCQPKIVKTDSLCNDFRDLTSDELLDLIKFSPEELDLYDICRTPRKLKEPVVDILNKKMKLSETGLSEDLSCSICIGIYQNVAVVKDCLHRFCADCIEKWIRIGHQDCPKCRKKIPSRRSLRSDPIFNRIISRLFPDVKSFESMVNNVLTELNQRKTGLSKDILTSQTRRDLNNSRYGRRGKYSYSTSSVGSSEKYSFTSEKLDIKSSDFYDDKLISDDIVLNLDSASSSINENTSDHFSQNHDIKTDLSTFSPTHPTENHDGLINISSATEMISSSEKTNTKNPVTNNIYKVVVSIINNDSSFSRHSKITLSVDSYASLKQFSKLVCVALGVDRHSEIEFYLDETKEPLDSNKVFSELIPSDANQTCHLTLYVKQKVSNN